VSTIKNGKYGDAENDRLVNYDHPEYRYGPSQPGNVVVNKPALYQRGKPANQMLRDRMLGSGGNSTNSDPDQ
jgi:hypothetical protein